MAKKHSVLVVDDDKGVVEWLVDALEDEGFFVTAESSARAALELVRERAFDVVISDIVMPEIRGLDFLRTVREFKPHQVVILITAFGSIDLAVEAVRLGAADFVAKPFRVEALVLAIERAIRERQMRREIVRLREAAAKEVSIEIVAESAAMRRVVELALRAANSSLPVLITGESGVGKGVVARLLHRHSPRRSQPFVQLNCAALAPSLVEAELFGVRRGAFTDAREDRPGVFEQADRGTLFLDEVGELPLEIQPKLLQVLETQAVRPVGGRAETNVDVRVIAATNRSLEEALRDRQFRQDLYHRLNVIRLDIPPLRARPDDIEALVDAILHRIGQRTGEAPYGVSAEALRWLSAQPWPGNVRELSNAIERAAALADHDVLGIEDFADARLQSEHVLIDQALRAEWSLDELERAYIQAIMKKTSGNKAQAARILGLDRRTLYRKVAEIAELQLSNRKEP